MQERGEEKNRELKEGINAGAGEKGTGGVRKRYETKNYIDMTGAKWGREQGRGG